MLRLTLACVAMSSLLSPAAFADDFAEDAQDQGLAEIAPGIFAVPGAAPPVWFTQEGYFSCSQGLWATTPGGEAAWRDLGVANLPQGLRAALDAETYAAYGLCPGDALPPQVATYIGGPTVVVYGGLPRIVRFGPAWRYYHYRPFGHYRVLAPPAYWRGGPAWRGYGRGGPIHGYAPGYSGPSAGYGGQGHVQVVPAPVHVQPYAPRPGAGYVPRGVPMPSGHAAPPQPYRAPANQGGGRPAWNGGHGGGGHRR